VSSIGSFFSYVVILVWQCGSDWVRLLSLNAFCWEPQILMCCLLTIWSKELIIEQVVFWLSVVCLSVCMSACCFSETTWWILNKSSIGVLRQFSEPNVIFVCICPRLPLLYSFSHQMANIQKISTLHTPCVPLKSTAFV